MVEADRFEHMGRCSRCFDWALFARDHETNEVLSDCCGRYEWDPSSYADAGEL